MGPTEPAVPYPKEIQDFFFSRDDQGDDQQVAVSACTAHCGGMTRKRGNRENKPEHA
jgi:hypothetical protein